MSLSTLHVPKITRFLGEPNRPKICVRGTKFNFKDWGDDVDDVPGSHLALQQGDHHDDDGDDHDVDDDPGSHLALQQGEAGRGEHLLSAVAVHSIELESMSRS